MGATCVVSTNVVTVRACSAGANMLVGGDFELEPTRIQESWKLVKESPDAFEITGDVFDNDTLLGWGFPKDKTALKDAVDTALKAVVADGTYAKLLKKYGLPDSSSLF